MLKKLWTTFELVLTEISVYPANKALTFSINYTMSLKQFYEPFFFFNYLLCQVYIIICSEDGARPSIFT